MNIVAGEAQAQMREDGLGDQSPRHGIAMGHGGAALQRQGLESMSRGVTQVEGLALAVLVGVVPDDVHLDLHRAAQALQQVIVVDGRGEIVIQQAQKLSAVAQHGVLDDLGKTRLHLARGEGVEVARRDDDVAGGSKSTDFVFQSTIVKTRFASYSGIDSPQQRSGHVDEPDTALEGRCRKAAQVGHHAAAQVDDQRVTCNPQALHLVPHAAHRRERLGRVTVGNGDDVDGRFRQEIGRVGIGNPHRHIVVAACCRLLDGGLDLVGENEVLHLLGSCY